MKLFNIRAETYSAPFQVTVDDNNAGALRRVLQLSQEVIAFNIVGDERCDNGKRKKNLYQEELEAKCAQKGWVGSPGDCSPPDCNCDACISSGYAYKFNSYEIQITIDLWEYLSQLFPYKQRKWGMTYEEKGSFQIDLHYRGVVVIRSNKVEVFFEDYTFNQQARKFTLEVEHD
jgi:hypothetical protein